MKVNRESFMNVIEKIGKLASPQKTVEQSDCIVFQDGYVHTMSKEVHFMAVSGLDKEATAAVDAAKFLEMMRRLDDDFLDIYAKGKEVSVFGKNDRRVARFNCNPTISMPFEQVEKAGKKDWKPLNEEFEGAIAQVKEVYMDKKTRPNPESQFLLSCIHIHPKWVEASNNIMAARYKVSLGLDQPVLVLWNAIENIDRTGVCEYAETPHWLKFRSTQDEDNPFQVTMSVRKYEAEYLDLSPFLTDEPAHPEKWTMPSIASSAESAELASKENDSFNYVKVELRPGKLRLSGQGNITGFSETFHKIKYEGQPLEFNISPKTLAYLCKAGYPEVVMGRDSASKDKIMVKAGKLRFATALSNLKKKKEKEE